MKASDTLAQELRLAELRVELCRRRQRNAENQAQLAALEVSVALDEQQRLAAQLQERGNK